MIENFTKFQNNFKKCDINWHVFKPHEITQLSSVTPTLFVDVRAVFGVVEIVNT